MKVYTAILVPTLIYGSEMLVLNRCTSMTQQATEVSNTRKRNGSIEMDSREKKDRQGKKCED